MRLAYFPRGGIFFMWGGRWRRSGGIRWQQLHLGNWGKMCHSLTERQEGGRLKVALNSKRGMLSLKRAHWLWHFYTADQAAMNQCHSWPIYVTVTQEPSFCGLSRGAVLQRCGPLMLTWTSLKMTLMLSRAAKLCVVVPKWYLWTFVLCVWYESREYKSWCVCMLVCWTPSALTPNGTASGCAVRQRGPATSRLEWRWRRDIDSLCRDVFFLSFFFFLCCWKLSQTWREWLQQ